MGSAHHPGAVNKSFKQAETLGCGLSRSYCPLYDVCNDSARSVYSSGWRLEKSKPNGQRVVGGGCFLVVWGGQLGRSFVWQMKRDK